MDFFKILCNFSFSECIIATRGEPSITRLNFSFCFLDNLCLGLSIAKMDRGIPTYVIPNELLLYLNPPVILTSTSIPLGR